MAKRKIYRKQGELSYEERSWIDVPIQYPVAVYYRQSTLPQFGNISTSLQLIDLPAHLRQLGWREDQIIVFDQDIGVSGAKPIQDRDGMSKLISMIRSRGVGAVACVNEDRLFRDISQVEVNIFLQACFEANVRVITPYIIYNFNHPLHGLSHMREFRFRSELAAEYLFQVVQRRLVAARQRLAKEGCFIGAFCLTGYMVDKRPIVDGRPNPTRRKYVPFEPYAEVVRRYFEIFVENNGNLGLTYRQIVANGPYFPKPVSVKHLLPDGHEFTTRLGGKNKSQEKLCPSLSGLHDMLVNPEYIGHWVHKGRITVWNNHPPLISEKLFFTAFNLLSDIGLDGENNSAYTPCSFYEQPNAEIIRERGVNRPLFEGLLFGDYKDRPYLVSVTWRKKYSYYMYQLTTYDRHNVWSTRASYIDEIFEMYFRSKLSLTFESENQDQIEDKLLQRYRVQRSLLRRHIETLSDEMMRIVQSFEHITSSALIGELQKQYAQKIRDMRKMKQLSNETRSKRAALQQISELRSQFEDYLEARMSYEQQVNFVRQLVERIDLKFEGKSLKVQVVWRDNSIDEFSIRRFRSRTSWTEEETKRLVELVGKDAQQLEIASAFPTRTWETICSKLVLCGFRAVERDPVQPVHFHESYTQYLERMQTPTKRRYLVWTANEDARLKNLVLSGATQRALELAFPERTWQSISSYKARHSSQWKTDSLVHQAAHVNNDKRTIGVLQPTSPIDLVSIVFTSCYSIAT